MEINVRHAVDTTKLNNSVLIQNEEFKQKSIEFSPELAAVIAGLVMARPQLNNVVELRQPNSNIAMTTAAIKTTLQNLDNGSAQIALSDMANIKNAEASGILKNFNTDTKNLIMNEILQTFHKILNSSSESQAKWTLIKGELNQGTAKAIRQTGVDFAIGAGIGALATVSFAASGFKMQQNGLNRERGVLKNDQLDLAKKTHSLNIAQSSTAKAGAPSLGNPQPGSVTQLQTQDGRTRNLQQHNQTANPRQKAHLDEAGQTNLKHEIRVTENNIKEKQNKADSEKATGMLVSSLSHPTSGVINGNTQYVQADNNADQFLHQQAGETSQSIVESHKESAAKTANVRDEVLKLLQDSITNSLNTDQFILSKTA